MTERATGELAPAQVTRYLTVPARALGFNFVVETGHVALGCHLDRLHRHLAAARPAGATTSHRYVVEEVGDSGPPRYRVSLEGSEVATVPSAEAAAAHLLWHVNQEALRSASDLLLLHAAAAQRDGVGVVLPGAAGAGKTTLVAGLVRAGMRYATDEIAAVDVRTLALQPYPKPLSLDRASRLALGDPTLGLSSAGGAGLQPSPKDEWPVDPDSLRTAPVADPCAVALVVAPTYRKGQPTDIVALSRSDTVVLLARSCFNLASLGAAGFDALTRLARGAPGYRLVSGDLDEAVDAVRSVMAAARP